MRKIINKSPLHRYDQFWKFVGLTPVVSWMDVVQHDISMKEHSSPNYYEFFFATSGVDSYGHGRHLLVAELLVSCLFPANR